MSDLADLISRLEKATGPDRELDAAIARYEKPCVFWRAAIHKPIWEKATPELAGNDWFERHECTADTATPAIALTIAALRARLSDQGKPPTQERGDG